MARDKTLSFFHQRRPDAVEHVLPIVPTNPALIPLGDLAWCLEERALSWECFANDHILATPPETVFFLDTSFLYRREIPQTVFDAILSRRVAITPLVWGELQDWLERPFANSKFRDVLFDAKRQGNSSVIFLELEEWSNGIYESVRYYVSLLSARKHLGISYRDALSTAGEPPSNESLTSKIQRTVADRGTELAMKGIKDHGKPNFSADEELVVAAVTYAIVNGCDSCILTRDRDPLEQFRKFLYLLVTHFRSSLIADSYVEAPENLIKRDVPIIIPPGMADIFEGDDRCMLLLPRRFVDWVVPKQRDSVDVQCLRLAGDGSRMKMASLTYGALRQMEKVLQIKGKTGGRNFELPDGLNCHLTISPPFLPHMGGNAIIGRDRMVQFGPFRGPLVDVEYAVQEVQRFRKQVPDVSTPESVCSSSGAKLADFFLSKRLGLAFEPGWKRIEWTELSKAIRHLDGAAMFFADRAVVPTLSTEARKSLIARRFAWMPVSRAEIQEGNGPSRFGIDERKALEKIHVIDLHEDTPWESGYGYYLALLSLRRQFARIIRRRVEKDKSRECTDAEVLAIAEHYGGIRGRRLAEQGDLTESDPHAFVGDELLAFGTIQSVIQGADVVFLTREPIFLDQFEMLMRFISTDYIACQFGRSDFAESYPRFKSDDNGLGLGKVMIRRMICRWEDEVLPTKPYLLNVHCWLLGDHDADAVNLSAMTFCAERGMHNLLRIKAENDGRNVENGDGKNVRAAITERGDGATISIWQDRMISMSSPDFPYDDRLDLRVSSLAAADISRTHASDSSNELPWCDSPFSRTAVAH